MFCGSISIIFYSITLFFAYKTKIALENAKIDLEASKLYNKNLLILHDKTRGFRHDFQNILQGFEGYFVTEDYEGLKLFASQYMEDYKHAACLSTLNLNTINNPAIYSLISAKYSKACNYEITFNLDVFIDFNTLNIKIYDFIKIFGILLDNAIEAARECNEKTIYLTIRQDAKVKRQLVIVENTYANKDIDTEKIFDKAYTTKPNNSGLGLWEIRQILKKNKNLNLFTTKNNQYFKQQLEIYL